MMNSFYLLVKYCVFHDLHIYMSYNMTITLALTGLPDYHWNIAGFHVFQNFNALQISPEKFDKSGVVQPIKMCVNLNH